MRTLSIRIVAVAIVGASAAPPPANWAQWRGPDRAGRVPAAMTPASWPPQLQKGWSVEIGEGYSSPIVADGRAFLIARRDPDELVTAIDVAGGKVVWEQSYSAPFAKNPYATTMAKGPYSTPLVSSGRLFTLGATGILSAWEPQTGKLLWRRDYSARVDTSKLFCGSAMSPIAIKEGIVVHVGDDRSGTVAAVDPATGKDVWTRDTHGPGYASPVEITVQGARQLATLTTKTVVGIAAATGELLWEFPFTDEWNENIVTPVMARSHLIVSGVRQGTRALAIERSPAWSAREVWHTPDVAMYMSSPVLVQDVLYGHSARRKGQFFALDPATGRVRWATEGRGGQSAAVLATDDHLVYLTSDSELVVAALSAERFEEIRRYTVASTPTYAHPVILRDGVLVRDAASLAMWRLH
jgi:outer membrane protein assembly factor BamB